MHVLSNLWSEYFSPETKRPKAGSECCGIANRLAEKRAELIGLLPEDGKRAFEVFERAQTTLAAFSEEDTFIKGFRLGAQTMLDILGEYHGQFR